MDPDKTVPYNQCFKKRSHGHDKTVSENANTYTVIRYRYCYRFMIKNKF